MGRRDVHRHGLRARRAGAADPPGGHPHAGVPAHAGGVRRPRRAGRDRGRLHEPRLRHGARRRDRAVRRAAGAALPPRGPHRRLGGGGGGAVGGDAEVGHRPARERARGGARHERLPAGARRPRAGERAGAFVPRAAHAGAREVGAAGGGGFDLGQRAHAVRTAPLGQLRRAATVRARQRRRPHHRRPARRRDRIAGLLRHRGGLRGRQAGRDHARQLGRLAARTARSPPADQRPDPVRGGHLRRDRLHGLAADLEPRLQRA